MERRPTGWPLPRPKLIHHVVEDFLTEWKTPVSHIQPLRRFLEHCVQTDLRAFYAESCFRLSLTHRKPPLFCQHGYLKRQGVPRNGHDVGPMPTEWEASGADPAYPNYLTQAGASISSGLNVDFWLFCLSALRAGLGESTLEFLNVFIIQPNVASSCPMKMPSRAVKVFFKPTSKANIIIINVNEEHFR